MANYKRSVREKAAESIHELRHVLDHDPVISPEDRRMRHPAMSGSRDTIASTEHSDYSYSAAVTRLRDMLHKVSPVQQQQQPSVPKPVLFVPPPRVNDKSSFSLHEDQANVAPSLQPKMHHYSVPEEVPSPEEMINLLRNEASRIQQLEAEKRFLSDELQNLKRRIVELVEENRVLHEELRRSVVHELTAGGMTVPTVAYTQTDLVMPSSSSSTVLKLGGSGEKLNKFDYEKWRLELEKINSLHIAKTSRLETQLSYTKEELQKYEEEVNELRKQLRMVE